jgi:hypothetical protein
MRLYERFCETRGTAACRSIRGAKTFAPNWWLRGIADVIGWAQDVAIECSKCGNVILRMWQFNSQDVAI